MLGMMITMPTQHVTRLAPSPTGALHLGNARTFIINWALARQQGWRIVLRIEDLDGPRIKTDADRQAIHILTWLGLDWDEGPHYQRHDLSRYHHALQTLSDAKQIYPCQCTRKEVAAAQSAPHGDEHELRYPGTCKTASPPDWSLDTAADHTAWRVITPDEPIIFDDLFMGQQSSNPQQIVGDFIVVAKGGLPSYQLAVVVDDAAQGVTQIVRGDDLVRSTPRQLLLYRLLGLPPLPQYTHLPLVLGPDGRRLAKRHGDTRLTAFRDHGVRAERVIGLLARWSGITDEHIEMSAHEFRNAFDLTKLPPHPITYTEQDQAWLTS